MSCPSPHLKIGSDVPRLSIARAGCWALLLAAGLGLAACDKAPIPGAAPGAPGAGGPPPAEVGVVTVQPGNVGLVQELPGRLEASRTAQVRARAAGILQERVFTEGSVVKAGQLLFRIDAASLNATVQSAEAALARAQANAANAAAVVERFKPLVAANAISQQEFTNAQAAEKVAQADVAVARAAEKTARINLDFASVRAPIAGRIGRALVTEGALVGQGEATPLAVINQLDPLMVNFTQSAAEVLRLRQALASGQLKSAGADAASVRVLLDNGQAVAQSGKLLFSDVTVDPTTGQVGLRAELPNPGGALLPGLYVRVQIEQAQVSDAISLPQQAVTRSDRGDSVMVVDAEGKVSPRPVKVGGLQQGQWLILDGLQAGDQVMVDGFQKLRGGAPVKAVPWSPPGSVPPAAAAAPKAPAN